MKKKPIIILLTLLLLFLPGCQRIASGQIVATTKPVYQFTQIICDKTPLTVELLVSENVSCLHDYTLQVSQMRKIENAELVVINGAGFEEFLSDAIPEDKTVLDCAAGIALSHCDHHHEGHIHEADPHIWLSLTNAKQMANNIALGLSKQYPQYSRLFYQNLDELLSRISELEKEASLLQGVSSSQMITFHDGFSYMAEEFGLHILEAIEEESGAEASAAELIEIICLIRQHDISAIFTEVSAETSAPAIIQNETGVKVYALDMGLSERDYFEAMSYNISTLKEALE